MGSEFTINADANYKLFNFEKFITDEILFDQSLNE
jgi:hypothetical protein